MISGIRVKEGNLANPTVWIIRIFKTADGWRALKPLWSKRSGKPLLTQRCLYKETEIDTPGGRWEIEWVEEGKRKRLKCGDHRGRSSGDTEACCRCQASSVRRTIAHLFEKSNWVTISGTIGAEMTDDDALVAAFDEEMFRIYERAHSEAKYTATRFLHMLYEHRGLETARILLHSATVSEGYTALWERGRLDLTVEAVIHDNPRWRPLFSEEELAICSKRLKDYRYLE
jgi:hypothetical protein